MNLFKNTVPVITDLRNEALKDRHWEKIEAVIGQPVPRGDPEKFTFNTLLELKVMHFKEQLQIISTEATQEGLLEGMLNTVVDGECTGKKSSATFDFCNISERLLVMTAWSGADTEVRRPAACCLLLAAYQQPTCLRNLPRSPAIVI